MRIATALLAGVFGLGLAVADHATAQEKYRWKLGSAYSSSLDVIGENIKRYLDDVKVMSDGRLDIHFFEPGALVPALQAFDAVSAGSIDASYTSPGFHAGKFPAASFFGSVPFGPSVNEYVAWMYFGGGGKLYNELYNANGVQGHLCGIVVAESSGWFRNEIKSLDDLKGLKMRFFGLGAKVMEKFGVSTQLLAGGDIYPALELGTLDATEFSFPSLDKSLGLYQIAKHDYFPGWHQQASFVEVIFNKKKYDALPKSLQRITEVGCGYSNMWLMGAGEAKQGEVLKFFKEKGVQIHKWPDEWLAKFETAWKEVAEEEAAKDPEFKKIWDNYSAFRASYKPWKDLAYLK
jgi:TRAP-type mannitol/chloroaromatic compound transport system substrate-binding protein